MKTLKDFSQSKYFLLVIFIIFLFTFIVVRSSWVMEDAYITLRTVDNFANGYGLTWNISERVQVFTHPLWMFVLSAFYFVTHDAFYTTIFISVLFSIGAVLLVVLSSPQDYLSTLLGLTIFIFSKAFIEYSTSGLENPLTHFLYALFIFVFLKHQGVFTKKSITVIALIASLAAVNRLDSVLLFVPALLFLLITYWGWPTIKALLIGFIPLIAWEIFSLVYYGFPFPNTAYAKIAFDSLSQTDLLEQGMFYFLNSLHWDPITLFTISLAIILVVIYKKWPERIVMSGVVLYMFYLLWIGGDNMSGRFFTAGLLASVVILNRLWAENETLSLGVKFAFIVILGFSSSSPTFIAVDENNFPRDDVYFMENGVADVRRYFYQGGALLFDHRDEIQPHHFLSYDGLEFKKSAESGGESVFIKGGIGYAGYFAGPQVHIIDDLALADPLLSRLPPRIDEEWRPGHLRRPVPEGYFETISTGENVIANPDLAAYYDKLKIIVSGPLWTAERWEAIWKMNTGQYDYLIESFMEETGYPY